jgi:ketosteroid isomerase-like protein
MDAKQNKQVIMQCYQCYKDRDIKSLLALYRDDIEWVGIESDHIPYAGSYHGKAQVEQFFKKMEQAVDVIKFEPKTYTAEDDRVVVTGTSSYRVKATGNTYDTPWVHVFNVRDGKVARFEYFNNTAAAEAAFRPTAAAGQSKDAPMRH